MNRPITSQMRYWLTRIASDPLVISHPVAPQDGKRLWALERRGLIAQGDSHWVATRDGKTALKAAAIQAPGATQGEHE